MPSRIILTVSTGLPSPSSSSPTAPHASLMAGEGARPVNFGRPAAPRTPSRSPGGPPWREGVSIVPRIGGVRPARAGRDHGTGARCFVIPLFLCFSVPICAMIHEYKDKTCESDHRRRVAMPASKNQQPADGSESWVRVPGRHKLDVE